MAKLGRTSVAQFQSMDQLFARVATRREKVSFMKSHPASCRHTLPKSFADAPRLDWLVDECLGSDYIGIFRRYRMSLLESVKVLGRGAPDQLVARHASQTGMGIATADQEFANYQVHDHARLPMTLVLPTQSRSVLPHIIEKSLEHFLRQFALHIGEETGVSVCYDIYGGYQAFRPKPGSHREAERFACGKFVLR